MIMSGLPVVSFESMARFNVFRARIVPRFLCESKDLPGRRDRRCRAF